MTTFLIIACLTAFSSLAAILFVVAKTGSMTELMKQVSSGRWLLTVGAMICMLALTLTDCYCMIARPGVELPVPVVALLPTFAAIYASYFGKGREEAKP